MAKSPRKIARGERNNNPGNIRVGPQWQGLKPREIMTLEQRQEKEFAVFQDPTWGIRAIAVTLITYQDKRKARDGSKIDTIQEVIDRWAPPVENNTGAYASAVAKLYGIGVNDEIDLHKYEDMRLMVEGIIKHELGYQPYTDEQIDQGIFMAGVKPPSMTKPVAKKPEVKAAEKIIVGGGLGAGVEVIRQNPEMLDTVRETIPLVSQIISIAPWAIFGGIAVGGAYLIYRAYKNRSMGIG